MERVGNVGEEGVEHDSQIQACNARGRCQHFLRFVILASTEYSEKERWFVLGHIL